MRRTKNIVWLVLFLASAVILMSLKVAFVYAYMSDYLNATIKISVCGNEIVEGGEDCEGENLNGHTCKSLGFGPGTLSCDIACSFDTHNCSPAPLPTPTPAPTTVAPTPETAVASSLAPAAETITSTVSQPVVTKPTLPFFLTPFDPDRDGKIALREIFVAAKIWIEQWREASIEETVLAEKELTSKKERKCDLNKDYRCDLKDFSILMSYVEK